MYFFQLKLKNVNSILHNMFFIVSHHQYVDLYVFFIILSQITLDKVFEQLKTSAEAKVSNYYHERLLLIKWCVPYNLITFNQFSLFPSVFYRRGDESHSSVLFAYKRCELL